MIRDAWALLSGKLTDHEYFRHLEADEHGLFYDVPRKGWDHRAGKLISALVEVGALVASVLLWIAIFVAASIR